MQLVEKYCNKTLAKGTERTGNWEAELGLQQLECMFCYFILTNQTNRHAQYQMRQTTRTVH